MNWELIVTIVAGVLIFAPVILGLLGVGPKWWE
jgi:hypothetical protein